MEATNDLQISAKDNAERYVTGHTIATAESNTHMTSVLVSPVSVEQNSFATSTVCKSIFDVSDNFMICFIAEDEEAVGDLPEQTTSVLKRTVSGARRHSYI